MRTSEASRTLLMVVAWCIALCAVGHVYAQDETALVQGVLWVDHNLDGVYQPDEPLLRSQPIGVYQNNQSFTDTRTDEDGRFTIRVPAGYRYGFVLALGPSLTGGWPTYPERPAYRGCSFVEGTTPGTAYIADIRMRATDQDSGIAPILLAPDSLPLVDGEFFIDLKSAERACDGGFAVTDTDHAPFWTTFARIGPQSLGRPISSRFSLDGHIRQAFEGGVLDWDAGSGDVAVVNWSDAGMESMSTREGPFRPSPPPHYLGLPLLSGVSESDNIQPTRTFAFASN
jgi:hypothetical protein